MLKQEALKRIFTGYISSQLDEVFSKYGFKYMKSKNAFKKSVGEFDYWVGFGHVSRPLHFDEANERLQFFYHTRAHLQITKFEKWYEKTFQKTFTIYPHDKTPFLRAWFPVTYSQFESSDFYEPTNSQKFKMYISGTLGGGAADPEALNFTDLITQFEEKVLPFFDQFKTWDDALNNDFFHKVPKIDFLLYAGKKEEYQQACIRWCNEMLTDMVRLKAENSDNLRYYQEAVQELNRKYQIIFQQDLLTNYEKISFEKKEPGAGFGEWQPVFSIGNLSPETYNVEFDNHNRRIVLGHTNCLASFWDFEGNKLKEVEIPYGGWMGNAEAGYVKELDCYYVNSFLYDNQFNKTVSLSDLGMHGKGDAIKFFPVIFNDQILIASDTATALYEKNGKLIKKVDNKYGKLIAVLPQTKKLLYYSGEQYHLVDKDFNLIHSLDTNKSNWESATAVSPNEQYLFAGGYYTKSYFYDLATGSKQVLWAHETFKEGYKDKYNVSHNFGVKHAKFSPDNSYLVVGADHAKHVAWEIPSLKRIELSPEHEFTFEGAPPNTEFANDISQIKFLDNGNFFYTIIRDYLLTWDRSLKHIDKTNGVLKIKFSDDAQYALITHNHKTLTLYRRK